MITSTANQRVKFVRSLARREARVAGHVFVLEGARLVADALAAGCRPVIAFHTPAFGSSPEGGRLVEALLRSAAEVQVVTDSVMRSMADTVTPQGVLAVASIPRLRAPVDAPLVLVLDGWQDPGNMGTVLRSAEAAGVRWVLIAEGSTDPFGPKVVRAAMGAHVRLPISPDMTWEAIREALAGRVSVLADVAGDTPYDRHHWSGRSALIIGGEAHGVSVDARALATVRVSIPMQSPVESLNAAVAASVILFEAARQLRTMSRRE